MRMPDPKGNFEDPPVGTWPARCYRVIDIGTQAKKFKDQETKMVHEILISWELFTDQPMTDGRNFSVQKNYTFSSHEKGNLRKDLESWRGQAFSDADFGENGFDVSKLLNVPALLSLAKNEKGYVNVKGVMKPLKGMAVPGLTQPTVFLSLDPKEFSMSTFDKLSDKLKEKIKVTPEYGDLFRNKTPSTGSHQSVGQAAQRAVQETANAMQSPTGSMTLGRAGGDPRPEPPPHDAQTGEIDDEIPF